MVAITTVNPTERNGRGHLRLVEAPTRPAYGLRRIGALVVLTLALALAVLVADAAVGALSTSPTGSATPVAAERSGDPDVVVVQPGDTLWTIAGEIAPDRDPRAVVDELVALNGSAELQAGQRLVLP